ncbi:MAG: histidine kinase [Chitinophagaceae bacterium]
MNKWIVLLVHSVACVLFLLSPIYIAPHPGASQNTWSDSLTQKGFLQNIILVIFFYINFFYFIPKFFYAKKYADYITIAIVSFIILATIPFAMFPTPYNPQSHHGGIHSTSGFSFPMFLFETRHLLILFFAVFFGSMTLAINYKRQQLQIEKKETELSYLKAQINPHFLFNTLNSIYALAIEKSSKTPEAIVKLSGLMRYLFSDTSMRFAPLEKEINYINSYIDLQKIRLDNTANIHYEVNGDLKNKVIAPLILIPFIENAFKHGVNPEESSHIEVQISITENNLYLNVFNLKVDHIQDEESKSGYGIDNGRRQLSLLYPDKHELKIENNKFTFSVNIKIELS